MKRPITFLKLAIVFLAFLSVPGIVWGVGTINSGFKVEKYSTGASSLTVDATSLGSACYRVSNNSNIDYFIPTSTSTEWNAFKNKVEAGNLSGVSLSLCTACTTIGNYCWTTQNLNVGTQVTGGTTPSDNGVVEKYCYNDDPAYCNTYGGLYSAQEMMKYLSGSGIQGICPDGFHLPTTTEVSDLIASGSSLFQGLMGGRYLPGSSYNLQGSYGLYWASPMYNAYYQAGIGAAITNWISQADGFNSVRCVRNPLSCVAGSYNNNGTCSTCPTGSWCYASVKNFCTAGTYNAYTGKSSADDCLPCDAGYTSLAGSDNINDCAAVPPTSCAYLGSYCWTTQSSNVGTQIAASATPSNNGVVEKYCYLDDPANCNTYGGFYTLNEATNYSTVSGVKGICPSGFHVPSTTEFDDLIVNLPLLGNSLFQGLSAGYTQGGSFAYFGSYGFYWSSGAALSAYLQPAYGPISYWTNLPSSYAISLRCVRDAICTAGQISGYSYNNINPGSSQYPVSKSVAHGTCTATVNCSATSFPSINGESATCDAGYFNTNGLCSDGCESQCGNGTCDIAAGENASNCIGDCNACTNGATRWMYDSGNSPVGCGTYCRSEQQTCVNGAWNGSYTGTADCSASDSERVGYQTASVNCGSSCVAQTQTCAYNGWNLSGIGSCSVNCFCVGATLDGYTYNNINYSASQYPVSKTVTQGTCTATVNCSAIGGVSVSGEVAACSAGYFNANGSCADGCESQCGNGTCDTVAGETITNCAGDCTVCTNGATRTRYDSGTSPFGCGVYCRSELQTCVSNAWNGSYTGISDCSALASIRTGYTTSSVTCGNTCSTQAQVCSHDGWNGTGIGSCSVDTCICAANTLNGYTYNNINYNSSQASITKNTTPSSTTTTNCKANVSCSGTGVATVTGEVATCVTGWFDNNSNCSADGCESQCGNDVCDTAAGETVANCANDCTVCTNGETRTRWDSGAGANSCGTYCRSEVQTCVNNAWNGTYTGTNDCTASVSTTNTRYVSDSTNCSTACSNSVAASCLIGGWSAGYASCTQATCSGTTPACVSGTCKECTPDATRTVYNTGTSPAGCGTYCRSKTQTCDANGNWPVDVGYTTTDCTALIYKENRSTTASVVCGATCASSEQSCTYTGWTGGYASCTPVSCSGSTPACVTGTCKPCTPGATRIAYDSGTNASTPSCGTYCRSESQTCDATGNWPAGGYTGTSDCTGSVSTRTGYTTSSVACGSTCATEAQTCLHTGWSGTGIGTCAPLTCCAGGTIPNADGYTYSNINYNSSQTNITKNTRPSTLTTKSCVANVSCSGAGVPTVTGEVASCETGWFDRNNNCSSDGCESQCGNGTCDTAAGETVANCADDCTVCTNGATRTRWDSGAGANSCGTYCRSEVQTCVNNAWNGTYTGTNDCTASVSTTNTRYVSDSTNCSTACSNSVAASCLIGGWSAGYDSCAQTTCSGATPTCVSGVCKACTPGATRTAYETGTNASTPSCGTYCRSKTQTCDVNGAWPADGYTGTDCTASISKTNRYTTASVTCGNTCATQSQSCTYDGWDGGYASCAPVTCSGTTPACVAGTCKACTPNATRTMYDLGTSPAGCGTYCRSESQTCDANGNWPTGGYTGTSDCTASISKLYRPTTASVTCGNTCATSLQSCTYDGWTGGYASCSAVSCSGSTPACVAGACKACTPGATRTAYETGGSPAQCGIYCRSKTQTCDATGNWPADGYTGTNCSALAATRVGFTTSSVTCGNTCSTQAQTCLYDGWSGTGIGVCTVNCCTASAVSGYSYNNINYGSSQTGVTKNVAPTTPAPSSYCTANISCSATGAVTVNGEAATCKTGFFNQNNDCSDGCESRCGNGVCDTTLVETYANCAGDCNICTPGATRWMYDSGSVACGIYCRSEQQTCQADHSWNGTYTGTADCSTSLTTRTRYQINTPCAAACASDTETCLSTGAWYSAAGKAYTYDTCVPLTCDGTEDSICEVNTCSNKCSTAGSQDGDVYNDAQDDDCPGGGCGQCTSGDCCIVASGCFQPVTHSCVTGSCASPSNGNGCSFTYQNKYCTGSEAACTNGVTADASPWPCYCPNGQVWNGTTCANGSDSVWCAQGTTFSCLGDTLVANTLSCNGTTHACDVETGAVTRATHDCPETPLTPVCAGGVCVACNADSQCAEGYYCHTSASSFYWCNTATANTCQKKCWYLTQTVNTASILEGNITVSERQVGVISAYDCGTSGGTYATTYVDDPHCDGAPACPYYCRDGGSSGYYTGYTSGDQCYKYRSGPPWGTYWVNRNNYKCYSNALLKKYYGDTCAPTLGSTSVNGAVSSSGSCYVPTYCGNGYCDSDEDCYICAYDCGACEGNPQVE